MSEKSNLEKSEQVVGQLRPVIYDASGARIVDGIHRKEANPEWTSEVRSEIKTEEDYWKARAHLNYTRRNASENRQEKLKIINNLAEYYLGQGLSIQYHRDPDDTPKEGKPANQILNAVINALDGAITASWVRDNLDKKYRQETPVRREPEIEPKPYKTTPEDAIRGRFSGREEQADVIIEDFKEQVREEVKIEVKAEAVEEAKEELRHDPEFLVETAATVEQVLPTLPEKVVDDDGFFVPKITEQQAEQLVEAIKKTEEARQERLRDPEVQERGAYYRMWLAWGQVLSLEDELFCPVCKESASTRLVFECHPENSLEDVMEIVKEKMEE